MMRHETFFTLPGSRQLAQAVIDRHTIVDSEQVAASYRDACARIELMEEYANRMLAIAAEFKTRHPSGELR